MFFVNLEDAYDRVHREVLWWTMFQKANRAIRPIDGNDYARPVYACLNTH